MSRYLIADPLVAYVFDTHASNAQLVRAAIHEVFDADYMHLTHGRRHTSSKGCKGPLCAKSLRDWQRQRRRDQAQLRGATVKPISRTPEYLEADIELGCFQAAYERTAEEWKVGTLDRMHTALIINVITEDWNLSCKNMNHPSIHWYLHMNELCAQDCKTKFVEHPSQLATVA